MQEELGPKCIVCQDRYTKKASEVMGMHVYSKLLMGEYKKLKI